MALSATARQSRKKFAKRYSRRTAAIVRLYAMKRHLGWGSNEISERLDVSPGTVAATLANLTRGTYNPFADVDFFSTKLYGDCNY